jgi:AP-1 complex subunit mu
MAVTNAVSWRTEGIRYRKNEVFLDVIESVNLLVNANGNVVRSEILGAVKMKCYLSGMPELRLGLNDKVMFESTGRSVSFISCLHSHPHLLSLFPALTLIPYPISRSR